MTATSESTQPAASGARNPASSRRPEVRWSLGASLSAAVGASICCLGPLVLLALGIGGAWAGALMAMEPLRPVFVVLALTALGWAFYQVYRPVDCNAGATCFNPRQRWRHRAMAWVAAVVILALLASPYIVERWLADAGAAPGEAAVVGEQVVLSIDGMTCPTCTVAIGQHLRKVTGVHAAEVTYEPARAVVQYDPAHATPPALVQAIAEAGFKTKVVEQESSP